MRRKVEPLPKHLVWNGVEFVPASSGVARQLEALLRANDKKKARKS